MSFPFELFEDADRLAEFQGWDRAVYVDFLALQRGTLTVAEFDAKYRRECAILVLDMTGFTAAAMNRGEIPSLLRIFDAQKVCIPALLDAGATLLRCFADNIVALFDGPDAAVDAALDIQRRVRAFNDSPLASDDPALCCIGLGFGSVYAIGPNRAQGDEMNRASRLGEDIARGGEILLTERAAAAIRHRGDVRIEPQRVDDGPFPFFALAALA